MMKRGFKTILASTLLLGAIGLASTLNIKPVTNVKAAETYTYPRNGQSGTIMLVSGSCFEDADLAIYCFNSDSDNVWSEKVSYRMGGGPLRMMIPYKDGQQKTWSKFIVCRYNKADNPSDKGWDGVINQTNDIYFSEFYQAQNTIIITGYGEDGKLTYQKNAVYYYGVEGEKHIYLDLTNFPEWEQADAKFAFYFAYPSSTNESRWSQVYTNGSYQPSFLWKVEGQTNEHLYEGIVPNLNVSGANLWNMVIAVRFDPAATTPEWGDNVWNQTQDLVFNSSNHNANIIRVNSWDSAGELLDSQYSISDNTRLSFYGQYFLDTVVCSGSGNSDATTSAMWNSVDIAYNHLSRLLQGDVWTTTADKDGTLIQQAMARYDYIVLYKQYDHIDFINRAESPNKTTYNNAHQLFDINDSNRFNSIIIILASIMAISTVGLIALKKYKSHKR